MGKSRNKAMKSAAVGTKNVMKAMKATKAKQQQNNKSMKTVIIKKQGKKGKKAILKSANAVNSTAMKKKAMKTVNAVNIKVMKTMTRKKNPMKMIDPNKNTKTGKTRPWNKPKGQENIRVNERMRTVAGGFGFWQVPSLENEPPGHVYFINAEGIVWERWHTGTVAVSHKMPNGRRSSKKNQRNTTEEEAIASMQRFCRRPILREEPVIRLSKPVVRFAKPVIKSDAKKKADIPWVVKDFRAARQNVPINRRLHTVAAECGFSPVPGNNTSNTPGHVAFVNDHGTRWERWHTGLVAVTVKGADGKYGPKI